MNKLVLFILSTIKNIVNFTSIVFAFLGAVISLNWIETIINAHWNWLNSIRPIINIIIDFSNKILPLSFNAFDSKFDVKYITSIILVLIVIFLCRKFLGFLEDLTVDYHNLHIRVKKYNENNYNKNLIKDFNNKEKTVRNYMILINTQWKKSYFKKENDSMGEQNNLMNDFIFNQTGIKHSVFNNGFLYQFDNLEKIDDVLDVMFKIIHSNAPLDYSISVQSGDNLQIIKKLSDLKEFNKIIMTAETLYRYNLNKNKRYQTQNVGVFQYENLTLEIHEFVENA